MFVFIFLVLHLNLPISILSLACSAWVNHQPSLNNQLKRNLETVIMVFTLVYEFSFCLLFIFANFPGGSDGKASVYNAGDPGSSPGLGRSPGKGNGNPLQYYCLENPVDRRAWQAPVYGVAKSQTRLSDFIFYFLSSLIKRPIFKYITLGIRASTCKLVKGGRGHHTVCNWLLEQR